MNKLGKIVLAVSVLFSGMACITPPPEGEDARSVSREVRLTEVRASERTVAETGIAGWHVIRRDQAMTVIKGYAADGQVAFEQEQATFERGGAKFTHYVVLTPAPYSVTVGEDGSRTSGGRLTPVSRAAFDRMFADLDPRTLGDRVEYGFAGCAGEALQLALAIANNDGADIIKALTGIWEQCVAEKERVDDDRMVMEAAIEHAKDTAIEKVTGPTRRTIRVCKDVYVKVKTWIEGKKNWADSDPEEDEEGHWEEAEEKTEVCEDEEVWD